MKWSLFRIICCVVLFFPAALSAQEITGLWKGDLFNDTLQEYHYYELAITKNNGKLSGYSYTVFKIDGREEVGIKKVKVRRKGDKILIEDEKFIYNNFSVPPPEGVHQSSEITVITEDSAAVLTGVWKTNRTKKYLPYTGTLKLLPKKDFNQAKLVKKLDEMDLAKDLSFNHPEKKPETVAIVKQPAIKKQEPVAIVEQPVVKKQEPIAIKEPKKTKTKKNPKEVAIVEPPKAAPVPPAAAKVKSRKTGNIQTVFYQSDSLTLSLYDNGEVDGDTVTVLMNDSLIYEKKRLSTIPNNKTVYIDRTKTDSIVLVMYAENLGSIPPNTGLLVVRDGESVYELRFSADLETNAQIILTRKKQE